VPPRAQQVERLHERHAGLEQRGELLVELQELAGRQCTAARELHRPARDAPARAQREDVQATLFEVVPQPGFALGRVHAFDDLAGRA
jgi:hypothetical protein